MGWNQKAIVCTPRGHHRGDLQPGDLHRFPERGPCVLPAGNAKLHSLYTDAARFFSEATYPTDGMRSVIGDVFARIAGDNSAPAIHRLETAFGGGKTHTLIACTHLAWRGTELAEVAAEFVLRANTASIRNSRANLSL